jgi:alcohol dehydrogenase class IV
MVISIGGGSAIDIGKIVAAMVPQSYTVYDFFESQIVEKTPLPFVALPTTAGTGSECTTVSVLTDTKNQVKKGVRNEKMTPLIALVDPGLTLNVPPDVTAQSGMDALTQAIEALVSRDANPISDALAIRGIELLHRHLPAAVSDGGRIENREPVALGSMITGMAFASAGLGAVHGLAHPIGALCHAPHGLICAVLLPHVCAFNQPAAPDKFNCIAGGMGLKSGIEVASAIMALNRRVGIPERLGKHGLTESLIPAIIPASRSGSMAKNPRNPTDEELREILMKVV